MTLTFYPETHGAKGDAAYYAGGTIAAGSLNRLTVSGTPFVGSDSGKMIALPGAGPSGADMVSILTYVDDHTVSLSPPASGPISGRSGHFGTDDTLAINAAIGDAKVRGGGVEFSSVYCATSLDVTKASGVRLFSSAGISNPRHNMLPEAGARILPLSSTLALADCTGSAGFRIERLQFGSRNTEFTGRCAILAAPTDDDALCVDWRLDDVVTDGRWKNALYVWGAAYAPIIGCRFWNRNPAGNGAVFTADNVDHISSAYVTIETEDSRYSAGYVDVYTSEFHNSSPGQLGTTTGAGLFLVGAQDVMLRGWVTCDSSDTTGLAGPIVCKDSVGGAVHCAKLMLDGAKVWSENAVSPGGAAVLPTYSLNVLAGSTLSSLRAEFGGLYNYATAIKHGTITARYGSDAALFA